MLVFSVVERRVAWRHSERNTTNAPRLTVLRPPGRSHYVRSKHVSVLAHLERETGFEPATTCLEGRVSPTQNGRFLGGAGGKGRLKESLYGEPP